MFFRFPSSPAALLRRINALEPRVRQLSDAEIRKESLSLRYRARCGEPLADLLPESYALVREAGQRTLNMRHFDVQILGGIALFNRSVAEMQTGEGKTLTATLPMTLYAFAGKGAMLATANDYLAKRDAGWMRPVYAALGMSVGVIQTDMPPDQRRNAYHCDITYGTAKEFGFDFLKDRLLLRKISEGKHDFIGSLLDGGMETEGRTPAAMQREPFFALVDEADSILIDEASTPLVISAEPTEKEKQQAAGFAWAAEVAPEFISGTDYKYDHDKREINLTAAGRQKVRSKSGGIRPLTAIRLQDLYQFVQRAVLVNRNYRRDEHYVVRDGEIVIVDEFTGRLGEGRKWKDGIHQSVEAKEHVKITFETGSAAKVTVQDYFRRFEHLAGMTGTAVSARREIRKIYRCRVVRVPTHHPPQRIQLPVRIFRNEKEKWAAVVQEIIDIHRTGRPVLIGTRTIDQSLILSELLKPHGIEHNVLNAYQIAEEAEIVAAAGNSGKVTVSTNMAGRGTDIKITDEIRQLGGLHVICTEMHESERIDRQLIGRCGRQGDPGTYRQYLSLDDEILKTAFRKRGTYVPPLIGTVSVRLFIRAQRKIETKKFRDRKVMLYHDKERKKIQRSMGQDPYLDAAD
ncbi:MAG: translocase [Planctomycetaceae bacterium]|jgi:preprotein translocase subunit SecA|nr:translocase [Planctomycetaceae bacterium]